jgi:hypothetical protein
MRPELLRSHWTPADSLLLVDCLVTGNAIRVGIAYIKRKIGRDLVSVYDSEGKEFVIELPENLYKSPDHIVQINTIFKLWKP